MRFWQLKVHDIRLHIDGSNEPDSAQQAKQGT